MRCPITSKKLYLEAPPADPLPRQGREDPGRERQGHRRAARDGSTVTAPVVVSNLAPDTTLLDLVGAEHLPSSLVTRLGGRDHRGSYLQIHFALDGLPRYARPTISSTARHADVGRHVRLPGIPAAPVGQLPVRHRPGQSGAVDPDPDGRRSEMAPEGKHAASVYVYAFPTGARASSARPPQERDGQGRHRQDHQVRAELQGHRDPQHHVRAVPHEHHVRCAQRRLLPGPAAARADGTEPAGAQGFLDEPIPIEGLYLGGAGCHGGPGITFIRATTPAIRCWPTPAVRP